MSPFSDCAESKERFYLATKTKDIETEQIEVLKPKLVDRN